MRYNIHSYLVISAAWLLSNNSIAQAAPPIKTNLSNIRAQAYLQLQTPYKECIKETLKQLYQAKVAECIKSAGLLADVNSCQDLAEKKVNQNQKLAQSTSHCNALKPTKEAYQKLLTQLHKENQKTD